MKPLDLAFDTLEKIQRNEITQEEAKLRMKQVIKKLPKTKFITSHEKKEQSLSDQQRMEDAYIAKKYE